MAILATMIFLVTLIFVIWQLKAKGTEQEKWAFFQRVRNEIGARIQRFAETGE